MQVHIFFDTVKKGLLIHKIHHQLRCFNTDIQYVKICKTIYKSMVLIHLMGGKKFKLKNRLIH